MLADLNSIHTQKWAEALAKNDLKIAVFGLSPLADKERLNSENIEIYSSKFKESFVSGKYEGSLVKLSFLLSIFRLRKVIEKFKPDVIHAHFASSYGLLASILNFKPFVLSVWGSDVFVFPQKSILHRAIIKFIFSRATKILSTSHIMALECNKYTDKNIEVTPFGIDLSKFQPAKNKTGLFNEGDLVLGTVKTLEDKYGISYLIDAFSILVKKNNHTNIKLLIVGSGSKELIYKDQVNKIGVQELVTFIPKVSYKEVPDYLSILDIYVALSVQESFGVAIIEASACEIPVIVSNVGGLPEVVDHGITGIVVPMKDSKSAAVAIEELILNKEKRISMGKSGREKVRAQYDWNENVKLMMEIYKSLDSLNS